MADPIKCNACGNDATVHLTQIINNKINKVDLCESCAVKKGVTNAEGFSLADLLSKANPAVPSKSERGVRCRRCGQTVADFRRTGRLGCPECYKPFRSLLVPALEDMHSGAHHVGKVPEGVIFRMDRKREVERLKAALRRAIEHEAYEEAAEVRDQIAKLEATALEGKVES